MRQSLLVTFVLLALAGCGAPRPETLGVREGRLAACPSTPNCVSSQAPADDAEHRVPPLAFQGSRAAAWARARDAVASLPRTEIVTRTDRYLHAECTSLLLRFVDDLELYLPPDGRAIEVRSGSRVGYSDLGVNRRRVEALRAAFEASAR